MPKQTVHLGQEFHLVPMPVLGNSEGVPEEDQAILHRYELGHYYGPQTSDEPEIINSREPSIVIHWSKATDATDSDVSELNQGFVQIEFQVERGWLERLARGILEDPDPTVEPNFATLITGSLSWRDLNVLSRTARTARDDAFGKPE